MDLSYFTLIVLVAVGAAVSFAVWMLGLLIRKRLRGPGRMIIMTVLLILWYISLYQLIANDDLDEGTKRAYQIAVHSIWIWWVWALMRFMKRVKRETNKTSFKTGLYTATGIHRVTAEVQRLREKRRTERNVAKKTASGFMPDI
jgi:hypothetical protein